MCGLLISHLNFSACHCQTIKDDFRLAGSFMPQKPKQPTIEELQEKIYIVPKISLFFPNSCKDLIQILAVEYKTTYVR